VSRGIWGGGLCKNIRRGWGKFSSHTEFEVGEGFYVIGSGMICGVGI
jgi:hypothetical protein